jgi:cytochrome o ubiquinol oxidase subunit 1
MMIVGGALFGYFAGITYWFPKIFGFRLNEWLGKQAFRGWFTGFLLAFVPLYILGLMGATRRLDHYSPSLGWQPLFIVAGVGVMIICLGVGFQILQFIFSIKQRQANLDTTGDPWNGRTLEWSTTSPAPFYNYAVIPHVEERDAFWAAKQSRDPDEAEEPPRPQYTAILMPRNTPLGLFIAAFAFAFAFAAVWHIIWLAVTGLLGVIICVLVRASDDKPEYHVSVDRIEKIEAAANKERYA